MFAKSIVSKLIEDAAPGAQNPDQVFKYEVVMTRREIAEELARYLFEVEDVDPTDEQIQPLLALSDAECQEYLDLVSAIMEDDSVSEVYYMYTRDLADKVGERLKITSPGKRRR